MLNTSLPTEPHLPSIEFPFRRGDVLDANGSVAIVLDVFPSLYSDTTIIWVRFVHNIGDSRSHDTLELKPGDPFGILTWTPATDAELASRVERKQAHLLGEIDGLLELVRARKIEQEHAAA